MVVAVVVVVVAVEVGKNKERFIMDILTISACVFWAIGLIWAAAMIYNSVKNGSDGKFD